MTPDFISALVGGEGIASVIAALAAWRHAKEANANSKQLQKNHGSSVADAVARIEAAQDVLSTELKSHGYQLSQMSDRMRHLESSVTGVQYDIHDERVERRQRFAELADDVANTFSKKG